MYIKYVFINIYTGLYSREYNPVYIYIYIYIFPLTPEAIINPVQPLAQGPCTNC